jgi:hypothetical protein
METPTAGSLSGKSDILEMMLTASARLARSRCAMMIQN